MVGHQRLSAALVRVNATCIYDGVHFILTCKTNESASAEELNFHMVAHEFQFKVLHIWAVEVHLLSSSYMSVSMRCY